MPPRKVVDNSVKHNVAGRSNFLRPFVAIYSPGRPDIILLNFEVNDVDMDLNESGSIRSRNRGKNFDGDGANKIVTRGGLKS